MPNADRYSFLNGKHFDILRNYNMVSTKIHNLFSNRGFSQHYLDDIQYSCSSTGVQNPK